MCCSYWAVQHIGGSGGRNRHTVRRYSVFGRIDSDYGVNSNEDRAMEAGILRDNGEIAADFLPKVG